MALSNHTVRTRKLFTGVATAALSLGFIASASAQNSQLDPTFGTITEAQGFGSTDITIQAGGDIDASSIAGTCNGFIADAPDLVVDYSGPNGLLIEARSEADTTIVVQTPAGATLCNDDSNGLNPAVETAGGETGSFAIWVGTFDPIQNNTYPDADVTVSELSFAQPTAPPTPTPVGTFDTVSAPTFGSVSLSDLNQEHTIGLQAGGAIEAFSVNQACAGFVAEVPDYVIDYAGGRVPMTIAADSEADTTLVVIAPDGQVYCNDDDFDLNPAVTINGAAAGSYTVYVGTYAAIENDFYPDATLTISSGSAQQTGGGILERARQTPTFGSTQLNAGFGAHAVDVQAGGFLEGIEFGETCNGFFADAPDYVVNYGGDMALRITATSQEDTTMAVVTPDGQVLCNDDFSGLNPGLVTPDGAAGDYAIWIGTFSEIQNETYPETSLAIEEISTTKVQPSGAITSISLTAGFTPDPFTTVLAAGGALDASTIDPACYGSIASEPDFVLNYTAGDWPLRIFVTSDADTTLLMRTPGGDVLCNDDADGLNPSLALQNPESGRYEVFIGTYDPSGGNPDATLAVTEILDQKELPEGALTETNVTLGMTRREFDLLAGGSFPAFDTFGSNCNGYVASNPDFLAYVDDAGIDVEMTVRSAEDTTLVVRAPDGQLICDDDSGGDFNPLVVLESAQIGAYEVWLGTFSSVGNAPAALSVRDINADTGTAPNVPGGGKK